MRILHVANFSNYKYGNDLYATDRKISSGLIQNGHFVYDFSYRDVCRNESLFRTTKFGTRKVNQQLLKACDNIYPDLLLLGHSELIEADTLLTIKKRYPDIKIGLWYVDALFHEQKMSHVLNRLPAIDMFFATTGGKYLKKYTSKTSRAAFIPNITDSAVEINTSFKSRTHENDLIFCGRDSSDPERQRFMQSLKDQAGSFLHCAFRGCLGAPPITGWKYLEFLSQSRMGLNISRQNDVELYSSDRLVQLVGNGLLTFCPKVPRMDILYSEEEIVYFDDINDLVEKLKYYHLHKDEGDCIAQKGWQKTHASYNAKRVTRYMLELLFEEPFSSDYEWQDIVYSKP